MIKKVVHNPTKEDIINYPIAEARVDSEGNLSYDNQGNFIPTDRSYEWTIMAGETLEFPGYVADYLKEIYDFLTVKDVEYTEEVDEKTSTADTKEPITGSSGDEMAKPKSGKSTCRHCGFVAANVKGLGLHIASKHPEKL